MLAHNSMQLPDAQVQFEKQIDALEDLEDVQQEHKLSIVKNKQTLNWLC